MCLFLRDSQVLDKLKTVDISYSKDSIATPDFTRLPSIQTLNFKGFKGLKELHISIGSLVSLVYLNFAQYVNLRSLQDTICNLRALKVLNINFCKSLEALPLELRNIESLKELKAWKLPILELPVSVVLVTLLSWT